MDAQTAPQYVRLEQPFGHDPPLVHCPVCGNAALDALETGGDISPCPHLAFIYSVDIGEFVHMSEDFQARWEQLPDQTDPYSRLPALLAAAGYDNGMLALEISYGGMACGPVWCMDVYGFDYGTLARDAGAAPARIAG